MIKVDEYILDIEVEDVIKRLRLSLKNGKLKDVQDKSTDIVVSCPFHAGGQEEHGSCFIRKNDGVFHCFGCDTKGPFVRFVAGCFDSSDEYAKNWLITNFPATKQEDSIILGEDISVKNNFRPLNTKKKVLDGSKQLAEYQSWCPYLGKRKLDRTVCEKFNVKYDPKYRQVIFPCYDKDGNIIMMPRRNIDTKIFFLDKDVEKPLYCLHAIVQNNIQKCLIVEGPIDCLTCWSHDVPAIATMGSVTEEQIQKINKSNIKILYLCFDNDDAGRKFAARVKAKLSPRIITVDVSLPKNRKDVNDLELEEWDSLIANYNLPKFNIKTA